MPASQGYSKVFLGMKHLNGNLICAVDTETTGVDPDVSGIVEIAVIPIDHMLNVHPSIPLFNMTMKPEDGEVIDERALQVTKKDLGKIIMNANTRDRVGDLLLSWFEGLKLAPGKKVIPLAHNWPFDREMIIKWIGRSSFDYIFSPLYRDTMAIASYLNDCADARNEDVPYSKVNLKWLTKQYNIEHIDAHTALSDALATANLYKEMVKRGPTEYLN